MLKLGIDLGAEGDGLEDVAGESVDVEHGDDGEHGELLPFARDEPIDGASAGGLVDGVGHAAEVGVG